MQGVLLRKREQLLDKAILFKSNAAKIHEFKKAFKYLNTNNIIPIVLKGAYLSRRVYKDIGVRFFNDVDILVRNEDVSRVENILFGLGYSYALPERAAYSAKFGSQISFIKGISAIDVHWDIVDLDRYNRVTCINIDDFWSRARVINMFDGEIMELSSEDLLIYLLLHLSLQHCFIGPSLYTDIREVIRQLGAQIDWRKIIKRTLEYGVRRPVYLSLVYAGKAENVDIPREVLSELKPRKIGILDRLIFNLLDRGIYFNDMDCIVMPFMLERWRDRLFFLLGSPKASALYIRHSLGLIFRALKKIPLLLKYFLLSSILREK